MPENVQLAYMLVIQYTDSSSEARYFNSREDALMFVRNGGDHVAWWKIV